MKKLIWFLYAALFSACLNAQDKSDPIVMEINGKDVPRSEFEYNFNKNNGDNVVDKKTVDEYAELFINYKLKVEAAIDAGYDTLSSFKKEFRTYRDQQVMSLFVSEEAEEAEVRRYYNRIQQMVGETGMIHPSHILVKVEQDASDEDKEKAKLRIDSIYTALQQGADFAALAAQCSDDKPTAQHGGSFGGWLAKGQTMMKEFEDVAFALDKGEISEPFLSTIGYQIVKVDEKKMLEPYDTLRPQIHQFLVSRGLKKRLASQTIDSIITASGGTLTTEQAIEQKIAELSADSLELKYLIQEYHDGLLLYEISNREVWNKAAKDTVGLEAYFKKNKKKYKWDEPRFRGIVFHCKDEALLKDVRRVLEKTDEAQWVQVLRATFNRDSVKQIRAEKNLFKRGDNAFVDSLAFKEKKEVKPLTAYPFPAVYGKVLKQPEAWTDVKGEVTADYQAECEEKFVSALRSKYSFEVYNDVLKTVNNH